MKLIFFKIFLLLQFIPLSVIAQDDKSIREPSAIEDNSFFVEEAFNQEKGVVQHISNVMYTKQPEEEMLYSFTQEWPLFSSLHQLSFTTPINFISNDDNGIGNIMVNYRYQLFTREDWAVVAPRLSLIVPTSHSNNNGLDKVGFEVAIPLSKKISESFIMHLNAGVSVLPNVKSILSTGTEVRHTLTSHYFAASVIWLASPTLNLMLEHADYFSSDLDSTGNVSQSNELLVNPALRFAINVGQLQIVPGIGLPIRKNDDGINAGLFFYLSFEHPF